tara:strand:- start:893 stop:1531 length:639 start_codon:yes stop_codon:yes gene_type:complete
MIKLAELIKLKKMVYTETIKPKHRNKMHMPLTVFREDLQLPYGIGKSRMPDNDSNVTYRELKYLASVKPNLSAVKEGDEVEESFLPLIEKNDVTISNEFLHRVVQESARFIMEMKYHYNRPRPYQIAEVYGMDLNGTELDSMKTPSYPSGHAVQGYLVAELLSHMDPKNSFEYRTMGERIAHSRIIAKAHYPSDKKFGKVVADVLFEGLIKK